MLRDVISEMSYSPIEAEIFSDDLEESARSRIIQSLNDYISDGRSSTYVLNSSNDYYLQGACFVEVGVDADETAQRKRERSRANSLQGLISGISPQDFERLCVVALDRIGAYDLCLTSTTADQGIDFYGRMKFTGEIAKVVGYPPVLDKLNVWVVGQAKHYPAGRSATVELRELVGSIQLARSSAYAATSDRYPGLRIRPCDPVFAVFITSGALSRDSWLLCRSSGLIAIDGNALVHILGSGDLGPRVAQIDAAVELGDYIKEISSRIDSAALGVSL